jgi:hypothetical protein
VRNSPPLWRVQSAQCHGNAVSRNIGTTQGDDPVRRTARLLTAVPVIASLVCASAVAAHAATASASPLAPGWRIAATFPAGSAVDHLAVSGPGSAWAVEPCSKPCKGADGVILRHWK